MYSTYTYYVSSLYNVDYNLERGIIMDNLILLIFLFINWLLFGITPIIILVAVIKDYKEGENDYE